MACVSTDVTDFYNFNQATTLSNDDNNFDLNSENTLLKTLIKNIVDCQYYDKNIVVSIKQNLSTVQYIAH